MGGEKLSRKQEAAIAALLSSPTLDDAAVKAGVSVSTLKRWRREPAFAQQYAEARGEIVERTLLLLLASGKSAVETLQAYLTAQRPADAIRAADIILSHAARGFELVDLAAQVAELRQQLNEMQGRTIKGVVG